MGGRKEDHMNFEYIRNKKVYLSSAMEFAEDEEMKHWRNKIKPKLQELGLIVLDPEDKKSEHPDDTKTLHEAIIGAKRSGHYQRFMELVGPVVSDDMQMVSVADFLIVFWDNNIQSVGTVSEVWSAYLSKKPILLVLRGKKIETSSWLMYTVLSNGKIFDNFNHLLDFLGGSHENKA